jgi:hypothetical protein
MPRTKKRATNDVIGLADMLATHDDATLALAMDLRARFLSHKKAVAKTVPVVGPMNRIGAPVVIGAVSVPKKVGRPAGKKTSKSTKPVKEEIPAAPMEPAPATKLFGRKLGGRGKGAE